MDEKMIDTLIRKAEEGRSYSYSPYSGFAVGAALLCKDGTIYTGCNIENAGFTPTNCAERTAIFKAISEGKKGFDAICVIGGKADGEPEYTAPCGVCRQVMMEFCDPKTFDVIIAKRPGEYKVFKLDELLPLGFGPDALA